MQLDLTASRRQLGLTLGLLPFVALACKDSGTGTASGPATCDSAADHLIALCGAIPGEQFRAQCEIKDEVPASTLRCIAAVRACSDSMLIACDVHNYILGCSNDSDCPAPHVCNLNRGQCVRCVDDHDCAQGRGCLQNLCFDTDTAAYKTLAKLFARDGGISTDASSR